MNRPGRAIRGAQIVVLITAVASLVAIGSAAPMIPAPGAASNPIQIVPHSPVQGDTLAVLVPVSGDTRVTVEFDGKPVPAFTTPGGFARALIGTDPETAAGTHSIRVTMRGNAGATQRATRMIHLRPAQFGVRRLTLPPQTFGLISPKNLATERQALGPVLSRRTPVAWWQGPFQAPSTGEMDSPYGEQGIYNGHREWWHQGVDFSAPEGSPVVAANAGVVALARVLPLGGGTVVIDHGQGVLTEYLHLSAFAVRVGERVEKGAVIGKIGATGLVTGPSLHWGLYVIGVPVNPLFWMRPRSGLTS